MGRSVAFRGASVAVAIALSVPRVARAEPPGPTAVEPQTAKPAAPAPPVTQSAASPSGPSPAPVTRRTVAFASAGIALLGAGLATTFGILALNNRSAYQHGPTLSNADDGNNDAAYADGALALTVAAGITSLVLFLTDEPAPASATARTETRSVTFAATPFLGPHGGGAGAVVRF